MNLDNNFLNGGAAQPYLGWVAHDDPLQKEKLDAQREWYGRYKLPNHKIGDTYSMDGIAGWKIAYYPIYEDGKTGKKYDEPRALVEKPMNGGTDFREVPLRYLTKCVGV